MRVLLQEIFEREHVEATRPQQPQSKAAAMSVLRQSFCQERSPDQTCARGTSERAEIHLPALQQELHEPRCTASTRRKGSPREEFYLRQVR